MMYQSKILKTKKRLSDDSQAISVVILAVASLLTILGYGFRAVTVESSYGIIPAEIPVIQSDIKDPSFHKFVETPSATLSKFTPAILLTTEAFYFGDIAAFTTKFGESKDKYLLRHVDGEPQLFNLIEIMQKWLEARAKDENIPKQNLLVFVPSGDIPLPIVMQVIAGFHKTSSLNRVILAGGFL